MREIIVNAIKGEADIQTFISHTIDDVQKRNASFVIAGTNQSGQWTSTADVVVNCLWEGQQSIDRAAGFNAQKDWITRVKYGFVVKSIPELSDIPSLIITHGPFGDIVNYPYDNTIYLTWYPACLTYIGQDPILPAKWEAACNGQHNKNIVSKIYKETLESLSVYVPQLASLELKDILAGTIMGHGKTDISDRESGLHKRHGIGVESENDYYSIFTGKYTSAPANALSLQNMLS
jgi:hypothetical protein